MRTQTSEAGGRRPNDRSARARLFLALEPDEQARAALAGWREQAFAGRDDLRLPAAEGLHVTLVFLGSRPESEIPELARLALSAVTGLRAPVLSGRLVVGVPRRRPRLFALDLADPDGRAREVHGAVAGALAAGGLHEPERRPFWPHLTLARVRGGGDRARDSGRRAAGGDLAAALSPLVFARVTLLRSHLGSGGARYEPLESCALVTDG